MSTKTVKIKDVPNFLQTSERFQERDTKKDNMTVVSEYWITTIKLDNESDFKQLLEVFNYWNIFRIPHVVYHFIESNRDLNYEEMVSKFGTEDEPRKKKTTYKCKKCGKEQAPTNLCVRCSNYFYSFIPKIKMFVAYKKNSLVTHAASKGFLDIIVYKHKQYLEQLVSLKEDEYLEPIWGTSTCAAAAWQGHTHVLKYLHENKCPWNSGTTTNAAWHGHFNSLQYALENGCPHNWESTCKAAKDGHFDCIKLLNKYNAAFDIQAAASTAFYNRIKILKWLYENGKPVMSVRVFNSAATNGSYECMEFLGKIGCPFNGWTHYHAKCCWERYGNSQVKNAEAFKELHEVRTKCLKYLEYNECPKYEEKPMMQRLKERD